MSEFSERLKPEDEKFLDAGYTKHDAPERTYASYLFDKKIRNVNGKIKYSITIYTYPHYNSVRTATVQFYKEKLTVDVSLHEVTTIEEMEQFFEDFWRKMKMNIDIHNN